MRCSLSTAQSSFDGRGPFEGSVHTLHIPPDREKEKQKETGEERGTKHPKSAVCDDELEFSSVIGSGTPSKQFGDGENCQPRAVSC